MIYSGTKRKLYNLLQSKHPTGSPGDDRRRFHEEVAFKEKIEIERKRTERSGRPFLLLLLYAVKADGIGVGQEVQQKLVSGMDALIRDTDVAGWYTERKVIGVIFTEVGDNPPADIRDGIEKKVLAFLKATLPPDDIGKVDLEFHFFPEEKNGEKNGLDGIFYPGQAMRGKAYLFLKRTKDIIVSLTALVLFLPFFFFIPILVKLSSRGPVLYVQERLGLKGEIFRFLKFRTMYAGCSHQLHRDYVASLIRNGNGRGAGEKEEAVHKMKDDPRITPIGRVLRKTSLDELPQFINVLKGEMSIVGPRPPIPYEYDQYDLWHKRRVIETKPGITGLWQVEGRSRCSFDEMVRLDLQYVRERSLWLDMKILLRTPWVMITGKGAY